MLKETITKVIGNDPKKRIDWEKVSLLMGSMRTPLACRSCRDKSRIKEDVLFTKRNTGRWNNDEVCEIFFSLKYIFTFLLQIIKYNEAIIQLNIVSRIAQNHVKKDIFKEVLNAIGNTRTFDQCISKYNINLRDNNTTVIKNSQM